LLQDKRGGGTWDSRLFVSWGLPEGGTVKEQRVASKQVNRSGKVGRERGKKRINPAELGTFRPTRGKKRRKIVWLKRCPDKKKPPPLSNKKEKGIQHFFVFLVVKKQRTLTSKFSKQGGTEGWGGERERAAKPGEAPSRWWKNRVRWETLTKTGGRGGCCEREKPEKGQYKRNMRRTGAPEDRVRGVSVFQKKKEMKPNQESPGKKKGTPSMEPGGKLGGATSVAGGKSRGKGLT